MGASRRHPLRRLACLLPTLLIANCSSIATQHLPENYGVYADTESGMKSLPGQKVTLRGNIMEAFGGIDGSGGFECQDLRSFVVYIQHLPAASIRLAELGFQRNAHVPGLMERIPVAVNLWIPSRNVEINVAPVEGKADMYRVRPVKPLSKGLYALYFGSFGSLASPNEVVFDIAVGRANDYPSEANRQERFRKTARQAAERLLNSMNRIFNEGGFSSLDDVYRPNGLPLSAEARASFAEGIRALRSSAGNIVSSRIVSEQVSNGGDVATYVLETNYERTGEQREEMRIQRVGDTFYVAAMK